jgi:dienelactone hydrolase
MARTEVVEYRDGTAELQGFVAYPDGAGRRPGVLVVHEWWGHGPYVRKRAEMLAGLGYVGFAVDLFGKGVTAKTPDEAGKLAGAVLKDRRVARGRIGAALDLLRKNPAADPAKVACIGYCMGGTVALELARSGADIRGAVSFHGALATPTMTKKGDVKCPVLVLHGADDPQIPSEQVAAFRDEMRAAGADWQFHEYGGAQHAFTNPDANLPKLGIVYNATADRRSWEEMKLFLAEVFA